VKVLIYVQHLVGIGHLRRALLLARAMNRRRIQARVVSGGRPVPLFRGDPVVQLPPAHCRPEDFSVLLDEDRRPVTEAWRRDRRQQLLGCFEREEPDVLLLETFPFGRRQFRFELLPLLERARARPRPPRIVCSIRDVLQRRSADREAETVGLLNRYFDEVWVHGDPAWIRLEESFSRVAEIEPRLAYTGYVAEPWHDTGTEPEDAIVVSAGGGAAGAALMHCAVRARHLSRHSGRPWRFLVGGDTSSDQTAALAAQAGPDALVEPVRSDFRNLLAGCCVSVSQLGYNTAVDLMQTGARAVAVPFQGRGETEQRTRAEVLAGRGLLEMVGEPDLSPETLAAAIDRMAVRPRHEPPAIALDGAERSAGWLSGAWQAASG